jgi:hypothetical protein
MICTYCAINADEGYLGKEAHKFCDGPTRCDCQHNSKSVLTDKSPIDLRTALLKVDDPYGQRTDRPADGTPESPG